MEDLKNTNKIDPLKRIAERQSDKAEYSPMDPPDAYRPPVMDVVPVEDLEFILQHLIEEHKLVEKELDKFENTLIQIRKEGFTKESNKEIGAFFEFLDSDIVSHHSKEDRLVFPVLHRRLIEVGEHGKGPVRETAVDMMENDHIKIMQLAALVFNLIGITSRLPDQDSRLMVLDIALEHAMTLIESLRLHIFREDNIVFALAHKHLKESDFQEIHNYLESQFAVKITESV